MRYTNKLGGEDFFLGLFERALMAALCCISDLSIFVTVHFWPRPHSEEVGGRAEKEGTGSEWDREKNEKVKQREKNKKEGKLES